MAATGSGDVRDIPHDIQFAPHPVAGGPQGLNIGPCHHCIRDNKPCDQLEPKCTLCRSTWQDCYYTTPSRPVEESSALDEEATELEGSTIFSSPEEEELMEDPLGSTLASDATALKSPSPEPAAPKAAAPKTKAPKSKASKSKASKSKTPKTEDIEPAAPKTKSSKTATSGPAAPKTKASKSKAPKNKAQKTAAPKPTVASKPATSKPVSPHSPLC